MMRICRFVKIFQLKSIYVVKSVITSGDNKFLLLQQQCSSDSATNLEKRSYDHHIQVGTTLEKPFIFKISMQY